MNKIQKWLVRRLLGADKIENLLDSTNQAMYKNVILFLADKLAEDSKKYITEFMANSICETDVTFIANFIEKHEKLDDGQKIAIINILNQKMAGDYIR